MAEILKFNELGSAAQEQFINHAHLLIDNKYVTGYTVEALAEQVYDNYIKERLDNPTPEPVKKRNSFLDYDRETLLNIPEIKKDDNWLK